MKRAFITGVTGQDGFFLTEYLLEKGYRIFGFARKQQLEEPKFGQSVTFLYGDITNKRDVELAIQQIMPDEVYNLASQSRPGESWVNAAQTLQINGLGAVNLFEAVKLFCPEAKVYHASSAEMFGQSKFAPQNEETPFCPTNPYAASKIYAHHMAKLFRESYGLFISNGILFNHESERRPLHFVGQKVAYGAACAALGIANSPHKNERGLPIVANGKLALGNLDVARDWGYAADFVRAMWLMLQHDKPDDFVIGTGKLHTLRELCDIAYRSVGKVWQDHVITDPALIRPLETIQTVADTNKAKRLLNWNPSISFKAMIEKMVGFQVEQLASLNNI